MRKIKGYLDEWRVQEYLLITFFISWLSWGLLILLTAFNIVTFNSPVGLILFGIGGFGPTISAIMCIDGKLTFKKLGRFIFGQRRHTIWYLLAFAALEILVIAVSAGFHTNEAMPWFMLPVVFLVCTLFGGGNEELGWRGTLQPVLSRMLEKKLKNQYLSFIVTMLIIGVVWAIWHLPLWFVSGSTQQGIPFGWFILSTIALAFWLGCLYRRTHSVFACMILHGLSNVLMSFFIIEVNWLLIVGFIVMTVGSVFLGATAKPELPTESQG